MNYLAQKYIGILSTRLENFKKKSSTLYNFRCPICGDSEKNKFKTRAYIYERAGNLNFHCHNCGASMSAVNFIKTVDRNLYEEMKLESYKDSREDEEEIENPKPKFVDYSLFGKLKKVSQLKADDPLKQFVAKRKIPNKFHSMFYDCPNFMRFTNKLLPNKFSEKAFYNDERRLLIPFLDKDKKIYGYTGRSIRPNADVKYISIILDDTKPKIFGMDRCDVSKTIYVVEGPVDSLFLDNCVAAAGGDLISVGKYLPKEKMILIYDNEPRKPETVSKIRKSINNGFKVCFWPSSLEYNDINDMVLSGIMPEDIKKTINDNSYNGLKANLELTKWSKI